MLRGQTRRAVVLWALACAEETVLWLSKRLPDDTRPQTALRLCGEWAQGNVKMPSAKKALLAVHAMARETDDPVAIALCHAVGQACAAVHVETHAVGLAVYELTAVVWEYGIDTCENAVRDRLTFYKERMEWCARAECGRKWAPFLQTGGPNREWLLWKKKVKK